MLYYHGRLCVLIRRRCSVEIGARDWLCMLLCDSRGLSLDRDYDAIQTRRPAGLVLHSVLLYITIEQRGNAGRCKRALRWLRA